MLHSNVKKAYFFGWFDLAIIRMGDILDVVCPTQAMEKTLDVLYLPPTEPINTTGNFVPKNRRVNFQLGDNTTACVFDRGDLTK